jgi:hypothetical protein
MLWFHTGGVAPPNPVSDWHLLWGNIALVKFGLVELGRLDHQTVFRGWLTSVEVFRLNRPIALSAFRGQAKGRQNVMLSVA